MNKYLCILTFFFLCSTIVINHIQAVDSDSLKENDIIWYKQPQVYTMAAVPPDDIQKYHVTVNGLWNGFIGDNLSSPFALGRLIESVFSGTIYHSDKEFVDKQHNQGLLAPATILTIQGHRSLQEEFFDEFASRSHDGQLCPWDQQADSYWMNSLNPGYIEWCIQHGKKAIDAGADMIVLDEIQGNSLVPLYQFTEQYTGQPTPGFSNITIDGFRSYLSEAYSSGELQIHFNISNIDDYDIHGRIKETINYSYNDRISLDPLIKDYQMFLEKSNYQSKKQLITELRNYADKQGKDIVISANSYALGTSQSFDFWAKGLIFADLLDLFTFENTYTAFFDKPIPDFYRTKWLAWERLAYAATDAPAVILIDTNTLTAVNENLFPLFGFSNNLGILCAEAYANKGSFVNYYMPIFNREGNWQKVKQIHEFVMNHQSFYDITASSYHPIGILFLYSEGMRKNINTYLGCAQALAESHIPFEVLFDGDDIYLDTCLSLEDLRQYPILVIPSIKDVTMEQINMIKQYVSEGGVAVVFDGQSLGYSQKSGEIFYGNGLFYLFEEDICKLYYESYQDLYRKHFIDQIISYYDNHLFITPENRKMIITPYILKEDNQIILHLVNYDHIGFFDFLWPQDNINIQLKVPDFLISSIQLYTLDGKISTIPFTINDDFLEFSISRLKDYAVILLK